MDILKGFGFDPLLFSAQVVNFLIMLFLLQRFALKPILKLLQDRKQTIAQGLQDAENAKKSLDRSLVEEKKILTQAQQSSEKLLDDAKRQAKEIVALARKDAQVRVDQIIASAKSDMEREQKKLEKELAISVAGMAIELVQKSLVGLIDAKDQQKVVESFAKKLGKAK